MIKFNVFKQLIFVWEVVQKKMLSNLLHRYHQGNNWRVQGPPPNLFKRRNILVVTIVYALPFLL